MKIDFKKINKELYNPKTKPSLVIVPKMKFIAVEGTGNPNNNPNYIEAIQILYSLSYGIKMNNKDKLDYTVPPLEGLWTSVNEVKDYNLINKDELIWKMMIRQPDFVNEDIFTNALKKAKLKNINLDYSKAKLIEYEEGTCVQMMHIGPFEKEVETFTQIDNFIKNNNFNKIIDNYHHHEIYLSDIRKIESIKWKTVLRVKVKK